MSRWTGLREAEASVNQKVVIGLAATPTRRCTVYGALCAEFVLAAALGVGGEVAVLAGEEDSATRAAAHFDGTA